MQSSQFSSDGRRLAHNLQAAQALMPAPTDDTMHVTGVAGSLYVAYEKLRNAAEYTEQHLLLRAAVERFLRRNIHDISRPTPIANDLIIELTQSRYLENDTISLRTVARVDQALHHYLHMASQLEHDKSVQRSRLYDWVVQVSSVSIERLLVPQPYTDAFVDFAFHHYEHTIARASLGEHDEADFRVALYCAIHRALMRSDIATTRAYWLSIAGAHTHAQEFYDANQAIDKHFNAPLTNKLVRLINRYSPPLRILRELIATKKQALQTTIAQPAQLRSMAEAATREQYGYVRKRLMGGVRRAVAFIFITKILLGLAIEIPYDLAVIGHIEWMPLAVNTLIPPLYMATVAWSIKEPDHRNTEEISHHLQRVLYESNQAISYSLPRKSTKGPMSAAFNAVYVLTFAISFGLIVWLLHTLSFNFVQGAIFFVFLSAVSFLRFRLLQSARELDFIERKQSGIGILSDFFYTPFVRLGLWLSDKYRRVNLVSVVLDVVIEMPLKTSLRILRQWASFMRDKREEI